MIFTRTKTALIVLFSAEVIGLVCSFMLWHSALANIPHPISAEQSIAHYKELGTFLTWLLLFFFLSAIAHLDYETSNITLHIRQTFSSYYLRALLLITCTQLFAVTLAISFFDSVQPVTTLSIYIIAVIVFSICYFTIQKLLYIIFTAKKNRQNVVIIGTNHKAVRFSKLIADNPQLGITVLGHVDIEATNVDQINTPYLGNLATLDSLMRNTPIDSIISFLPVRSFYDTNQHVINAAESFGIAVHHMADYYELKHSKVAVSTLGHAGALVYHSAPMNHISLAIKRLIDLAISICVPLLLSPVMLLIALHIRRVSPGPIFFKQTRVGLNKREFTMYKFRTMIPGAEKMQDDLAELNEMQGASGFKIENDPRLIKGGRILRSYSLDELPQFWNVFWGDMSVVGPRPLSLSDYKKMPEDWQFKRFSMKPGLSCIWQVEGRNAVSFDEWMAMDLAYIDSWSLRLDFIIMIKTIHEVLSGGGK